MTPTKTTIERFINECEIRYHGELISREAILRDFACEIERLASVKGHTVGIMLHTGSKLFTVISMAVAAVLCVAEDFRSTEEIVESLNVGDIVIIDNKRRAKYLGRSNSIMSGDNKAFYVFESENLKNYYSVERIGNLRIVPYSGTAKKLNSMGIHKAAFLDRIKFISYVWDADEKDVSSLITKSFLFLTDKTDAIDIYENTTIKIKGKEYKLSDIITASYFTESKEYPLGSNTGKERPVLIIYSDLQDARKALIEDSVGEKRIAGLFAIGDEYLKNGIEALLSRQGTSSSYYSGKLDYSVRYTDIAGSDAKFWTLDASSFNASNEVSKGKLLNELKLGAKALSGEQISKVNVSDGISTIKYREIRNACRWLKENAHDTEEFVVQSFSFLNLLISAVFPLHYLDDTAKDAELVRVDSTADKINRLRTLAESFWGNAKEKALIIVDALAAERERIYDINPKGAELIKILSGKDRPQAIIIPKAYYGHIIKKWLANSAAFAGIQLITVGEAKNAGAIYENILFVCASFGIINPQSLLIAPKRQMLVYDCESLKVKLQEKSFAKDKNAVLFSIGLAETETLDSEDKQPIDQEELIEIDTENMIGELMFSSLYRVSSRFNADSAYQGATADISKIVIFSGGEYAAYFTKRSSVYRIRSNKVEDIDVGEIVEGDILLFSNADEGRDLFKVFMKNLLEESDEAKKEFEEAYYTSLQWKQLLGEYIKVHGGTEIFAQKLKEFDIKRDQMSIRQWADDDSHIIGPHSTEAEKIFSAIGNIIGDADMTMNAKQIAAACATIRSLRMRMLDAVKKIVVNKFNGNDIDPLFAPIARNIGKLSIMMQAEHVKDAVAGVQMPAYQTNRPIAL